MAFTVPQPAYESTITETADAGATSLGVDSTVTDLGKDLDGLTLSFLLDKGKTTQEYVQATVDTANSQITSISYLDNETGEVSGAGTQYGHRVGQSTIEIADFPYITHNTRALGGLKQLDSTSPMEYDGNPTFTPGSNEVPSVKYIDDTAIAGAPDATETTKGLVEIATSAELAAGTDTGATGAQLSMKPSELATNIQNQGWRRAADTGAADAYAVALTPAVASYVAGLEIQFMAANPNTGASTLDVNSLGTKNIKKYVNGAISDLEANDIVTGSCVEVVYDGTQFILETPPATGITSAISYETQQFFSSTDISGAEAETLTDNSIIGITEEHRHRYVYALGQLAYKQTTSVDAGDHDIINATVPGGLMGDNGSIRIRLWVYNPSAGGPMNMYLKFGGTTFNTVSVATMGGGDVTEYEYIITNNNDDAIQTGLLLTLQRTGGVPAPDNVKITTQTIDTSSDQTLQLYYTQSAGASYVFQTYNAIAELIPDVT